MYGLPNHKWTGTGEFVEAQRLLHFASQFRNHAHVALQNGHGHHVQFYNHMAQAFENEARRLNVGVADGSLLAGLDESPLAGPDDGYGFTMPPLDRTTVLPFAAGLAVMYLLKSKKK